MLFHILHDEPTGRLSYLLADGDSGEATLIDPGLPDLAVWLALLDERQLRLRWVLRTEANDTPSRPGPNALARLGAPVVQGGIDDLGEPGVAERTPLPLGHTTIRILRTPGRTPACLSFQWQDRVFCGGLLNVDATPGACPPADAAAWWDSVTQRIFTLPDETLLFAGQGRRARAVSTVLEQRRWHPCFARLTRDAFLARMAAAPDRRPGVLPGGALLRPQPA